MTENPSAFYKLADGQMVNKEYLEKFAHAQRDKIEYLVKSGQLSRELANRLLRDRGEKTPEIFFEK